jgi:hypothetical protein
MKAIEILDSFLKFADLQPQMPGAGVAPQTNLMQAPLASGQPPKRESEAINKGNPAGVSGNAVTITPATKTNKPLK